MKNTKITTALVKAKKAPRKGKDTVIEVTSAPVSAPDMSAPAPAPAPAVIPAPAVSAGIQFGVPNLGSRRINPRAVVRKWRIANNQRKDVFSAGATHYVQGGEELIDPYTSRSRFEVAIEIPFNDHYLAKVEWVKRKDQVVPALPTQEVA